MDLATAAAIANIIQAPAAVIGLGIAIRSSLRGTEVIHRVRRDTRPEPPQAHAASPEPMTREEAFEHEKRFRRGDFLPVELFVSRYKQQLLNGWMLIAISGAALVYFGLVVPFSLPIPIRLIFFAGFAFGVYAVYAAQMRLERRFPRHRT